MSDPVVIVGAGMAGLACAHRLQEGGVDAILFEAEEQVGGRVRTDEVDGFLLDRGFQILLSAYPEARRLLDYADLELRPFYPGALVRFDGAFHRLANPLQQPLDALGSFGGPIVRVSDLIPLARLGLRGRFEGNAAARRETTTFAALCDLGFSGRLIESFLRPFLGGVFLDPSLETTSRMLDFVLPMFANGVAAVPARGMGAIPSQLAAGLPSEMIRCSEPVAGVSPDEVTLASGSSVAASAVVVAADGPAAAGLLPEIDPVPGLQATCLYFAPPRPPTAGPMLVLDGEGRGPVTNLVVMSEVAPSYAPAGSALVSATVLGDPIDADEALEAHVRAQLETWFGSSVSEWRHLRTYRIAHALPAKRPPIGSLHRPTRVGQGIYVCGDHRNTASLQGAMLSGRLAAENVIEDLGVGVRSAAGPRGGSGQLA